MMVLLPWLWPERRVSSVTCRNVIRRVQMESIQNLPDVSQIQNEMKTSNTQEHDL